MLDPSDRKLMLEILRPPEGFELNYAIGTTYSLDLIALLSVPLSFSRFDWEAEDGDVKREMYALTEALRRHSEQMTVFCQAGEIYKPATPNPLFIHLENTIVQVSAPKSGVFHPKIWVLRFENEAEEIFYRLACLSRNLTFDNSWDTSLVLEGLVIDRQNAISVNHPLSDFVAALPGLANGRIDKRREKKVLEIATELRRVSFIPPDGIGTFQFLPLGIEGYHKSVLEGRVDRILIVSPFIDGNFLEEIYEKEAPSILVSRIDTLNGLDRKYFRKSKKVYVLSDSAEPEKQDSSPQENNEESNLEGLHAKLFVIESGRYVHLYTGSSNATMAAFKKNVEFLVKLSGLRSNLGIDAFMEKGEKGRITFADLLKEFVPAKEVVQVDKEKRQLELAVEKAIHMLAAENLKAVVSPTGKDAEWAVRIESEGKRGVHLSGEIVAVTCWPIGISEAMAVTVRQGNRILASFESVSTGALTSFFAFRFQGQLGLKSLERTRVISIPLLGAPEDRKERLLRAMLQNRDQLLRFLFFILADEDSARALGDGDNGDAGGEGTPWSISGHDTLFESLVRALHQNPRRLDEIAQIIADLEKTGEGLSILPEGFQEIWEPIYETRERIRA